MIKSTTSFLTKETFLNRLLESIPTIDNVNIIDLVQRKTVKGIIVCTNLKLSSFQGFAVVTPNNSNIYDLYCQIDTSKSIETKIDNYMRSIVGTGTYFFDDQGTLAALFICTKPDNVTDFVRDALVQIAQFGYCVYYLDSKYRKVLPQHIPYLLLASLDDDHILDFLNLYSVIDYSSVNYLLTHCSKNIFATINNVENIKRPPNSSNLLEFLSSFIGNENDKNPK